MQPPRQEYCLVFWNPMREVSAVALRHTRVFSMGLLAILSVEMRRTCKWELQSDDCF